MSVSLKPRKNLRCHCLCNGEHPGPATAPGEAAPKGRDAQKLPWQWIVSDVIGVISIMVALFGALTFAGGF